MKEKIYLAYGSNMDLVQMEHRCPGAQLLGKAELEGWRLLFKGSLTGSYATIEQEEGYRVPVLVWAVSAAHEASLDRYEGFPTFYYKREIPIQNFEPFDFAAPLDSEPPAAGMAYVMHEERQLGVPEPWYYDVLLQAYWLFDFDDQILKKGLDASRP